MKISHIYLYNSGIVYRLILLSLILFIFSGCASLSQHDIYPAEDGKYTIAVLPIKTTAKISKLSEIESSPPKIEHEKANIQMKMNIIASRLDNLLIKKLADSKHYHLIPVSMPVNKAYLPTDLESNRQWLKDLGFSDTHNNIQAVLQINVAGYGKLKKQWVALLIGSGIVEGIVQGVVATRLLHNEGIGWAVGLEEIGQELLTWGGGSYLFDSYYSPVTIEARLFDVNNGKEIWSDTVFVGTDKDALKLYPQAERDKREVQLAVTAYKAIDELGQDLEDLAKQSIVSYPKNNEDMFFSLDGDN